ncbi:amino acid acetyltransferase [Escherichia coli]|nr:amino acid acetyltransferase [Escherichia coli]
MVKERKTELVEGFRHSVPYINTHRGKTFVIMLGGEAIEHENFSSIVNDIGLLHSLGIRLVVVYGARPQIDANLAAHHHEPLYHKNIRVTDAKTLELVKQAAGTLQLDITARLSMSLNNTPLQGAHINVVSGNLLLPSRWASMTAWITAIAGVSGGLMKTRSIVNWTAVQ